MGRNSLISSIFKEENLFYWFLIYHVREYVVHFIVALCDQFLIYFQDDIGDKSVFMFNALGEDEQRALIAKLEQQEVSQIADQNIRNDTKQEEEPLLVKDSYFTAGYAILSYYSL